MADRGQMQANVGGRGTRPTFLLCPLQSDGARGDTVLLRDSSILMSEEPSYTSTLASETEGGRKGERKEMSGEKVRGRAKKWQRAKMGGLRVRVGVGA